MLQYPCSIDEIPEFCPSQRGFNFDFFIDSQIYSTKLCEKPLLYRFYQWPKNVNYRYNRKTFK